jgi:hypothetical protein
MGWQRKPKDPEDGSYPIEIRREGGAVVGVYVPYRPGVTVRDLRAANLEGQIVGAFRQPVSSAPGVRSNLEQARDWVLEQYAEGRSDTEIAAACESNARAYVKFISSRRYLRLLRSPGYRRLLIPLHRRTILHAKKQPMCVRAIPDAKRRPMRVWGEGIRWGNPDLYYQQFFPFGPIDLRAVIPHDRWEEGRQWLEDRAAGRDRPQPQLVRREDIRDLREARALRPRSR